jgi:tetratricopeptide (TPR) repeat protein
MTISGPLKLGIIIASLAVMGLASRESVPQGVQGAAPGSRSLLSNYVASQFAQSTDDLDSATIYVDAVLESDPANPVLLRRAFELNLGAGKMDRALVLAQRIYKSDPTHATAAMLLMSEALRTGQLDAAEAYTKGLPTSGIEGFLTPLVRAWIAQGRRQLDVIPTELEKLDNVPAFRSYLQEHRGYLALSTGDPRAAIAALGPLVAEQSGGGMRVREAIAASQLAQGNREAAVAVIAAGRSISTAPLVDVLLKQAAAGTLSTPVASPRQGVGQLFLRTGIDLGSERATPLALVLLRMASLLTPDYPDVWLALADVLVQADQTGAALKALAKVPASSPLALEATLTQARIHDAAEAPDQALGILEKLAAQNPDSIAVITQKADVLRRLERFAEAAKLYSRSLELSGPASPERWQLLYMRGVSLERSQQWDAAEADLKAALALRPDDPNILNYLGYSWVEQSRNLDQAKAMLDRAVALRPADGFITDSLGWAHYVSGNYEEAVRLLEAAVAAEPGDPTINDHLGDAYWKTGRLIEARFRWKAALAAKPEPDKVAALQSKVDFGLDTLAGR